MPPETFRRPFFRRWSTWWLTLLLVAQAAALAVFTRPAGIIPAARLSDLPQQFGTWISTEDLELTPDVLSVLSPDDYLIRNLTDSRTGTAGELFVAYFSDYRSGEGPHSPTACLPGAGWKPIRRRTVSVPNRPAPFEATWYLIEKSGNRRLVLYWLQNRRRVVPDETTARFYLAADTLRFGGKQIALVRLAVPVTGNEQTATDLVQRFALLVYPEIRAFFPAD